jgi:hypothetical protein
LNAIDIKNLLAKRQDGEILTGDDISNALDFISIMEARVKEWRGKAEMIAAEMISQGIEVGEYYMSTPTAKRGVVNVVDLKKELAAKDIPLEFNEFYGVCGLTIGKLEKMLKDKGMSGKELKAFIGGLESVQEKEGKPSLKRC